MTDKLKTATKAARTMLYVFSTYHDRLTDSDIENAKDALNDLDKALAEPNLLNQTCCGCGRSGGYALYCGWCWNKGDKPVGYVDQSDLDREGHDFWVSRQPSKNSVPLFIRKSNDT